MDVQRVAVGSTVSELIGSLVTALPSGARVAVPEIEFTSTLFPLLVQKRLDVRTVPLSELVDAVADGVDAVAFSAVQMSTGEVADLDGIAAAATAGGRSRSVTRPRPSAGCRWTQTGSMRSPAPPTSG